jgi:iron complex transport system permease protein
LLWILLLGVCVFASLFFGAAQINVFSKEHIDIVIDLRLSRALFAVCVGAMLGLSGAVYQLILRNPLADSFTTGAASSSALGAVLAIALGVPVSYVPPFALATGIIGIYIVYRLSGGAKGAVTMILCGVILNIVASSVIGFTKFYFEDSLSSIVYWLMGGFYFLDFNKLMFASITLLIGYAYMHRKSGVLDVLALDEQTAATSGVNVRQERAGAFFFATLLVAVSVSYSGLIGFVGLIVPHLARSLFSSSMKNNIFYSSVFGAMLLLVSDTIARTIVPSGAELPVGIVTSVLGGFFFFYILTKRRAEVWHD